MSFLGRVLVEEAVSDFCVFGRFDLGLELDSAEVRGMVFPLRW